MPVLQLKGASRVLYNSSFLDEAAETMVYSRGGVIITWEHLSIVTFTHPERKQNIWLVAPRSESWLSWKRSFAARRLLIRFWDRCTKIFSCTKQALVKKVFSSARNSARNIYKLILVWINEMTFSGYFFCQGQQKSLITKSRRTNTFQRNLFKTLTSKRHISLLLIPTTHWQ